MVVTRYVNTASSAGGDGTTNATSGANRAYASLSEWEAARQGTLSDIEEVICEGTAADTTGVVISGWTTSASNYILIRTTQANRHPGYYSTSHYRIEPSSGLFSGVSIQTPYVRISGLQFSNSNASLTSTGGVVVDLLSTDESASDVYITECIVGLTAQINTNGAFFSRGGRTTFINCVATRSSRSGFNVTSGIAVNTVGNCYNCVSVNNAEFGFTGSSSASLTYTIKNCYGGGNNEDFDETAGIIDSITTSASAGGFLGTTTVALSTSSGAYFTNVSSGTENFHIGASSALKAIGTDLSSDFTIDIDGQTRPTGASTWDIGVDQITFPSSTLDFPNSPDVDEELNVLGRTYIWDGDKWYLDHTPG